MSFALAAENVSRFLGAPVLALRSISAAADIRTSLAAAHDFFLLGHTYRLLILVSHWQALISVNHVLHSLRFILRKCRMLSQVSPPICCCEGVRSVEIRVKPPFRIGSKPKRQRGDDFLLAGASGSCVGSVKSRLGDRCSARSRKRRSIRRTSRLTGSPTRTCPLWRSRNR